MVMKFIQLGYMDYELLCSDQRTRYVIRRSYKTSERKIHTDLFRGKYRKKKETGEARPYM